MAFMAAESRHVSVHIDRPLDVVYEYAGDPTNMPAWAPGLLKSLEQVDGQWIAESGAGRLVIEFTPPNPYGVLDHDVTFPSGQTFHNPLRVLPDGDGCEIVFTVRRQPDMTDAEYDRDCGAVLADLQALKRIVEGRPG
jgi:hypothetical protein